MAVLAGLPGVEVALEHRPERLIRATNISGEGKKRTLTRPEGSRWKKAGCVQKYFAVGQLDQLRTFDAPLIPLALWLVMVCCDRAVVQNFPLSFPRSTPQITLTFNKKNIGA